MATEIKLLPGEEIAFELETDVITALNNPIAMKVAQLMVSINRILGTTNKVKLIVTNKRVLQITKSVSCYCFPTGDAYQVILPHSIKEVGYLNQATCFGLVKSYFLYYEGLTEKKLFVMKKADDALLADYVSKFYAALNA